RPAVRQDRLPARRDVPGRARTAARPAHLRPAPHHLGGPAPLRGGHHRAVRGAGRRDGGAGQGRPGDGAGRRLVARRADPGADPITADPAPQSTPATSDTPPDPVAATTGLTVRYGTIDPDAVEWLDSFPPEQDGPVWMVNLMRYRDRADYADGR